MSKEHWFTLALALLAVVMVLVQMMYPQLSPCIGWPIVGILSLAFIFMLSRGIRKGKKHSVKQVVNELLSVGIFSDERVNILRILYHDKDDLKIGLSYRKVLASEQDKLVYGELITRNIVQLVQRETGDILVLTESGKSVILYLEKNPQVLHKEGSLSK